MADISLPGLMKSFFSAITTISDGRKAVPVVIGDADQLANEIAAKMGWADYYEVSGTGVSDNDLLFTSGDLTAYNTFMFQCSTGAVDVEGSLDGTEWTTAALALEDLHATDTVTASTRWLPNTSADKILRLKGKFKNLRVRQKGATAATCVMVACNS